MFKRLFNLVLLIAGVAFIAHYGDKVIATTDHMTATVQQIGSNA